eukprot:4101356-Prorocentrum_lima.AAC.1
MTSSLVGSEMCIRDRSRCTRPTDECGQTGKTAACRMVGLAPRTTSCCGCLLYTSDAADDM